MMARTRSQMATAWRDLSGYFAQIGDQYEQRLDQLHIVRLQESMVVSDAGSAAALTEMPNASGPADTAVPPASPPTQNPPDN